MKLFAVTDEFYIIPLMVVKEEPVDGYIHITTEIVGEHTQYASIRHKLHFMHMRMGKDGSINRCNVFPTEADAKAYARKWLSVRLERYERDLNMWKQRMEELS